MTVVTNSSPVCYLVLIDEIDLLPRLYSHIHLTDAVASELSSPGAPDRMRDWMRALPSWISQHPSPEPDSKRAIKARLHAGEKETILLAEYLSADLVILDDRAGRREVQRRKLPVAGTLAVLGTAHAHGLVDLPSAIDRLRKTSFRYSPSLLKSVLDRYQR